MNRTDLPDEPLALAVPAGRRPDAAWLAGAERAWRVAAEKVRGLVERAPGQVPLYTEGGRWRLDGEVWTNWCEGFLPGQLWLLAAHTGSAWFREQAESYSRLLEPRADDTSVHDLGFLFWSSWRRWYDATGEDAADELVVHAGRTLAGRFQERGRYLCSFLGPESTFIDIMMNVGIVFHAARRLDDPELARRAYQHCLTSRRFLVRGDGSTAHEGIFDTGSGAFLRHSTQQGWRADSCWARGQAWAIHGFGTAYRHSGDTRFRETAQACAELYLAHTATELIGPNDFDEPAPRRTYESSAAAIAAAGLWQLAGLLADSEASRRYADHALATLRRLCDPEFLASGDPAWEGILRHAVYHEDRGLGVDESVMWGDYFFLDALDQVAPDLLVSADRPASSDHPVASGHRPAAAGSPRPAAAPSAEDRSV